MATGFRDVRASQRATFGNRLLIPPGQPNYSNPLAARSAATAAAALRACASMRASAAAFSAACTQMCRCVSCVFASCVLVCVCVRMCVAPSPLLLPRPIECCRLTDASRALQRQLMSTKNLPAWSLSLRTRPFRTVPAPRYVSGRRFFPERARKQRHGQKCKQETRNKRKGQG